MWSDDDYAGEEAVEQPSEAITEILGERKQVTKREVMLCQ
jgi:hypothetical protein